MLRRNVIQSMNDPRQHRNLHHAIAQWSWWDRQVIDSADADQLKRVADALGVTPIRVYDAIKQVGPRAGDIRKYLQQLAG